MNLLLSTFTFQKILRPTVLLLCATLLSACDSTSKARSIDEYDVSLPEDCPVYAFQEFQEPYGVLYCEVYIGCFGTVGNREDGGSQADTVEDCLALICGGANGLEGEEECWLDDEKAGDCLNSLAVIASDLEGNCPNVDDAWFPEDCGMAIECTDD